VSADVLDASDIRDIGPYRMATRIAAGATADVFRALKRQSAGADRAVVIKRLLPSLAANAEARAMFEHEAKLGLRVRHQNVVEVLDYDNDGECPYLVLEYVFGVDLRRLAKWLKRENRTLSLPLAAWVGAELLAGLQAVHSATDERGAPLGIVHRDVSPSNVFISVHGDVKLGDLGIARALGAGRGELTRGLGTRSTAAKGKLGYLAPEQVNGGAADTRSDVFAAATLAAELLMGGPLFGRGSELEVLLAIRDARCDALLDRATAWPPKLLDALMAALARLPDRRTQSAEVLRKALSGFVTVPESELHGLLGAEVVGALDAAPDTGNRESLARTIEADTGRIAIIAEVGAPARRERETMRPGVGSLYSVRSGTNALGPWPYARVVQALHTGEVEPSSFVSVDGGAEKPIASHSALAAHLPPSTRISTLPPPKPKPSKLGRTSESWNLGEAGLGSVLAQLLVDGETGLLVCEHDGTRKEIFVDRGAPTFVTSNRLGEMLGQRLVEQGVIDRIELDVALAAMPRFEGRLGDTLIALGLIDPLELFGHIAAQEREKLLDVFTWRAGRAALYRQAERPSRGFPLQLDAWDLLTQGLTRRLVSGRQIVDVRDVLMRSPTWGAVAIPLPVRLQVLLDSLASPRALEEIAQSDVERAEAMLLVELGAAQVWSAGH
jgi:serine/threonine protein kinase